MMRKIKILPLFLSMTVSCGIIEIDPGEGTGHDGIWTGPPADKYSQVCYVTAFDYQDGYDWRSDTEKGTVPCSLVVFADGVPVLKVPVGESHEVSSDPLRHRVVGGHLYTDWTDGAVTVIRKDGKELFRYAAAETVVKLLVADGAVHTLNRPVDGEGFTYRVDGEVVLERDTGQVFGHLDLGPDGICFCFSNVITEASGQVLRHYCVVDGSVSRKDVAGKVLDARMFGGEFCATVLNDSGAVVFYGGFSYQYAAPAIFGSVRAAEYLASGDLCVHLQCSQDGSSDTSVLWLGKNGGYRKYLNGRTLSAAYVSAGEVCAVYNPVSGQDGKIYQSQKCHEMPADYDVRGMNPVAIGEDGLYVGLSSRSGGPPAIWRNGETTVLDVNGYIARVSLSDDVSG